MNWGNPDTLERFLYHALGRQYTLFSFANSWDTVVRYSAGLVGEVLAGPGWPSVALALVGLPLLAWGLVAARRDRPLVMVALVAGGALLFAFVIQWGATSNVKMWLIPLGAVAALFGGIGLSSVGRRLAPSKVGRFLPVALGAVVCLLLLSANWARSDQSNLWRYRDRWRAALSQMDKGAIFVAEFDVPLFAAYYLQQVEEERQDITVVRAQGLWYQWYLDSLPDPDLRRACAESWKQVNADLNIGVSNTPEFWQGTAQFAQLLARHYRGRRTVYALHGSVTGAIQPPPYFLGLSEDLVRLDFALPAQLLRAGGAKRPLAEFPGGRLTGFTLARSEVGTGEAVRFRVQWQTQAPLSEAFFGIRLRPVAGSGQRAWERLVEKGHFVQGFPVGYGLRGLSPSPPGAVYEQEGEIVVPSNAPPGDYALQIAFAPGYPPQYGAWVGLGDGQVLHVRARPLPANRP